MDSALSQDPWLKGSGKNLLKSMHGYRIPCCHYQTPSSVFARDWGQNFADLTLLNNLQVEGFNGFHLTVVAGIYLDPDLPEDYLVNWKTPVKYRGTQANPLHTEYVKYWNDFQVRILRNIFTPQSGESPLPSFSKSFLHSCPCNSWIPCTFVLTPMPWCPPHPCHSVFNTALF